MKLKKKNFQEGRVTIPGLYKQLISGRYLLYFSKVRQTYPHMAIISIKNYVWAVISLFTSVSCSRTRCTGGWCPATFPFSLPVVIVFAFFQLFRLSSLVEFFDFLISLRFSGSNCSFMGQWELCSNHKVLQEHILWNPVLHYIDAWYKCMPPLINARKKSGQLTDALGTMEHKPNLY